jgi:uncharacterized membrane protein
VVSWLLPLVLLLNGLSAGVLLGTLLGGFPLLASLPEDQYVQAHAFFAGRYDPWMPACLMGALAGDVLLATDVRRGVAAGLLALAALLCTATLVISLTQNVPTNRWVRSVDPADLPHDVDIPALRERWGRWNRLRGTLTILALAANCTALATLL